MSQTLQQIYCKYCDEPIPVNRRGSRVRNFCSELCNQKWKYQKRDSHKTGRCSCSFCKTERTINERIRNIIKSPYYPDYWRYRYVKSERNFVK